MRHCDTQFFESSQLGGFLHSIDALRMWSECAGRDLKRWVPAGIASSAFGSWKRVSCLDLRNTHVLFWSILNRPGSPLQNLESRVNWNVRSLGVSGFLHVRYLHSFALMDAAARLGSVFWSASTVPHPGAAFYVATPVLFVACSWIGI